MLARTKSFLSPGPDSLPYGVLKAGSIFIVPVLCKLFQFFFDIFLRNSLPYDIVNSSSLSSFKLRVTEFLQGKNLSYRYFY